MANAIQKVIRTGDSTTATVLRLALGGVMFAHGAQKALGWFGGYGIEGTMGFLTQTMGLPAIVAGLVIAIELVGSLALILGALTRAAALGIGAVMIGAVATTHLKVGFFMDWGGQQAGEGFEYHILALAMVAALMLLGGGALSVDRALTREAR
jgi:putative oxidoreductase